MPVVLDSSRIILISAEEGSLCLHQVQEPGPGLSAVRVGPMGAVTVGSADQSQPSFLLTGSALH